MTAKYIVYEEKKISPGVVACTFNTSTVILLEIGG